MTTETLRALIRGSDSGMSGETLFREYATAGMVALGIVLALLI